MTPSGLPLFFGVAVFDFEGNGVIINVMTSMKKPEKFDCLMKVVIAFYISLLASFSALAYYVSGQFHLPEVSFAAKID